MKFYHNAVAGLCCYHRHIRVAIMCCLVGLTNQPHIYGQGPEIGDLVKPEIADHLKGREIEISKGRWQDTIEQLSHKLDVPIVTFIPERYESESYQGPAITVFTQIAKKYNGVWAGNKNIFILTRAIDRLPNRPITKYDIEKEKLQSLPTELLFLSLEDAKLKTLSNGNPLRTVDLSPEQRELLNKMLKASPIDAGKFFTDGKIYGSLSVGACLLWRGTNIDIFAGSDPSVWRADPFWERKRSLYNRDFTSMIGRTKTVFKNEDISIKTTDIMPVSPLEKTLSGSLPKSRKFIISSSISDRRILITKGQWQTDKLAAAIEMALHLELREVEDIIFLGPTRDSLILESLVEIAHQCDVQWQLLQPIVQALENNPRNQLKPFQYSEIAHPRMIPWSALSPDQRKFALSLIGVASLPDTTSKVYQEAMTNRQAEIVKKYASDLDLFIYPTIRVDFTVPELKYPEWRGFGPSFNYGWLINRFPYKTDEH